MILEVFLGVPIPYHEEADEQERDAGALGGPAALAASLMERAEGPCVLGARSDSLSMAPCLL